MRYLWSHAALAMVVMAFGLGACRGSGASPGPAPPEAATGAPAVGPAASAAAATMAPPPQQIRMTYPGRGICCLLVFAAHEQGFFEHNGLEVESLLMTSDRAMAAMASGELHYVGGAGTASIAAAALGLPVRAVWTSAFSPAYTIFTRAEITTLDQLKGKRMGVQGFGGTTAVAMGMALKRLGMDAERDLVVLQIGIDELLLEALRSGAIDATSLNPPQSLAARREGFTPLVDVASLVQLPLGGLAASQTKLQHEPDQVRRLLRALNQAQQWMVQNADEAVQMIVDVLQLERPIAEGTYAETMRTYDSARLVSRAGIENILQILRDAGRIGPEIQYEDVADDRLAREVARELGLIP